MSKKIWKEYELKEDLVIPKGTVFGQCREVSFGDPWIGCVEYDADHCLSIVIDEEMVKLMENNE